MGLVESSYAFEEMYYSECSTPKSPLSLQPFPLSPLEPVTTSDGDSQASTPEEPGTMTPTDVASDEPPVELPKGTPDDLLRTDADKSSGAPNDDGVQSSPSQTDDAEANCTDLPLVDSPLPLLDLVDFDTGLLSPSPFNLDTPALDTLDLPSCTSTAVHTPLPSFVKSEDAVPLFDALPLVDTMPLPWCISQNALAASPFTPFAWADANTTLSAPFGTDLTVSCDPLPVLGVPLTAPPLTAPLPAPLATPISTSFAAPLSAPAFAPTPYEAILTALNTPKPPPASLPATPAQVPKLLPVPKAYKHHSVPPRIRRRDEDDEGSDDKPGKRAKVNNTNTSYTLLEAYVSHVEYDCVTGKWWE